MLDNSSESTSIGTVVTVFIPPTGQEVGWAGILGGRRASGLTTVACLGRERGRNAGIYVKTARASGVYYP